MSSTWQTPPHSGALAGDIVVASGNSGKVAELSRLLSSLPFNLRLQSELGVTPAEETGCTFVENALLKARAASEQTGLPALADDSGLAVDALGGAPGVYSARYAGDEGDAANNGKLLAALAGVPEDKRTAQFHCVLVLLRHAQDPTPVIAQAAWQGRILSSARGIDGFGYDPLFFVPSHGVAAAELDRDEKNRISHRGLAVAKLLKMLDRP